MGGGKPIVRIRLIGVSGKEWEGLEGYEVYHRMRM